MTDPTIFNQILIWPILNVLIAIYNGLVYFRIPGAFGLAVVVLTVAIRLVLYPLTLAQLRSAKKLSEIKPKLDKLSQTHKNDKMRLQQEQMNLYKEAGINPAAGCLPLLLQMPVLIALYQVFWQVLSGTSPGKLVTEINQIVYFPILKIQSLDLNFFRLDLASKPSDWQKIGWWLLLVPLITALLQYVQGKMMMPAVDKTKNLEQKTENLELRTKNKEPETKKDDMSSIMQGQMTLMMPLMIGFFAYSFPIGLAIYWNTFSVFGIIQQYLVNKENSNINIKKL
ncbi:MAG: 60 kDa inner membrane insertion protein [Candidatus Gottesmanbacteria bacterium GW2011_GWA2_41_12]|uniref:60 kDa inner membrane insertion protein n=2 Tax=Candidatus Gottesmaniibacteriota TaxID=1752720 RepID=A0A0G0XKZ7_9BACT|nr:MAG: 60 kDa inner membrane insertion protein [Candidatus Gottesmanbacteria bacterium GW2011_GWC2_39_8]KKR88362.1 MAG: 60 kDa inner membrane insertion protein [Candidatus Gottesmanbacteria bacterium GW2011_GWA2_41_12]